MTEPLSHDAFIFLSELKAAGGQASRELLTRAVEERGIKDVDKVIFELQEKRWLVAPYSCNEEQHRVTAHSSKNSFFKPASHNSRNTKHLIVTASKWSNANYRAVVEGKKARFDPLHEYARRCISRQDWPQFWQAVREMTDAEQRDLRTRVARLLDRGSRD